MSEMEKLSLFRAGFKSGFLLAATAVTEAFGEQITDMGLPTDDNWDAKDEALVRENYLEYITQA